jgi:hypothetical protein
MASAKSLVFRWGWFAVTVAACGGGAFSADPPASGGSSSGGGGSLAGAGRGGSGGSGGKPTSAGASQGGNASAAGAAGVPTPVGGARAEAGAAAGGEAGSGGAAPNESVSRDGLVFWFKADAGVVETNGAISRWADQSGAGRDAVQSLSAQRPKLTKTAGSPLPVVEFDGKSLFELPPLDAPLDQGLTFLAVAGRSESVCTAFLELSNGKAVNDIFFGVHARAAQFEVEGTWYYTPQVFDYDVLKQLTMRQEADMVSTKVEIRIDGAFVGSGPVSFPQRLERSQNLLGHTQHNDCTKLVGAIGELLLYARPLPREEQAAVESYLHEKWQLGE